jgi:hypothetical protein
MHLKRDNEGIMRQQKVRDVARSESRGASSHQNIRIISEMK